MQDLVVNNLQEETQWLDNNPNSIFSGFSYSTKLAEQVKDENIEFQFSANPKRTFTVLKFLPIQGKAISDFLPGSKDDQELLEHQLSKSSSSKPSNSFGLFSKPNDFTNRTPSSNSLNSADRTSNFGSNTGSNFGSNTGSNFGSNTGSNFGNNASSNFGSNSGSNFGSHTGSNFGSHTGSNISTTSSKNVANSNSFDLSQDDSNWRDNDSKPIPLNTNYIDIDEALPDFPILNPVPNPTDKEITHILSPSKNFNEKSADNSKWRGTFAWSNTIDIILADTFGYHQWRSNQKEIINATMSGKDVFVTMPTGGGKSLCYQIPAACSEGISIVISPLISLIEDQVMIARSLDLKVDSLSSSQSKEENDRVWRDICSLHPQVRLLFVTPERLAASSALKDRLLVLARNGKLDRFVIDEAHCVSQWGHDFRPDYCKLSDLKKSFPRIPILAMTATATQKAKKDIIQTLGIDGCEVFSQSFNRTNLWYEIREKNKSSLDDIISYINSKQKGKSGIIYCLSQRECEEIAKVLQDRGISANYYHAGIKDTNSFSRSDVQADWSTGKTQVVVATIAFGMGINKSDVRFVIHYCLPKSLEGFYQESGRAGRDGRKSDCILYYNYKDKLRLEKVMDKGFKENHTHYMVQKNQKDGLNRVVSYCQNTIDCRRQLVLNYFGEAFQPSECKQNCDNCAKGGQVEEKNLTKEALQLVDIVQYCERDPSIKSSATIIAVTAVFRGTKGNKKLESCPHSGSGKDLSKDDVARLIHELTCLDILREAYKTTEFGSTISSLRIGPKSVELRQGTLPIILKFRKGAQRKASKEQPEKEKKERKRASKEKAIDIDLADDDDIEEIEVNQKLEFQVNIPKHSEAKNKKLKQPPKVSLEEQLLKQLTELRAQILKEENRAGVANTSTLFQDEALEICAKTLPRTLLDFQKIEGIGKTRADKWGARFINLILDHIEKHPELDEKPKAATTPFPNKITSSASDSSPTDSGLKRKIQAAPFQPSKKIASSPASSNNATTQSSGPRSPTDLKKFAYKSNKTS